MQNENVKIEQNLCQGAEYPGRKTAFSYWIAGKRFPGWKQGALALAPKKQDVHPMLDGVAEQIRPGSVRKRTDVSRLRIRIAKHVLTVNGLWKPSITLWTMRRNIRQGGRINIKAMTYELFVRIDITDSKNRNTRR